MGHRCTLFLHGELMHEHNWLVVCGKYSVEKILLEKIYIIKSNVVEAIQIYLKLDYNFRRVAISGVCRLSQGEAKEASSGTH